MPRADANSEESRRSRWWASEGAGPCLKGPFLVNASEPGRLEICLDECGYPPHGVVEPSRKQNLFHSGPVGMDKCLPASKWTVWLAQVG